MEDLLSPKYESRTLKVDYIGELPVEITLEILLLLALRDVLSCMLVSREWYNKIRTLGSYWRRALVRLAVPASLCDAYRSRHAISHREMVLRVLGSRQTLKLAHPVVCPLTPSSPPHIYFQCNHAQHTTIVSTLYYNFSPQHIIVHRLQPGTGKLVQNNLFKPISSEPQNRVAWAHHYCDHLLVVTAGGRWRGYNLAHNGLSLDWQGPALFDPDVVFGCCELCFLVVAGKLVSIRQPKKSYWEVHLFRFGRGRATPSFKDFRVDTLVYINQSVAYSLPKKLFLLSRSCQLDHDGFCQSHWLLVQSIEGVYVHHVGTDSVLLSTPLTVLSFHHQPRPKTELRPIIEEGVSCPTTDEDVTLFMYDSVDATRTTAFTLSLDAQLLACVSSDELHIWKLTNDDGFAKESIVSIPRRNKASVCLLAVGHVYSILGYESVEGHFQVITTFRGETVFSTYGFSGLGMEPSSTVGTPPPYFTFLGITHEEWLSEGCGLPLPHFPFLLFWDKKRHAILGIILRHGRCNSSCDGGGSHIKMAASQSPSNRTWRAPVEKFFQRFK